MGYQPRVRSPKGAVHRYQKPLREKGKGRKRVVKDGKPAPEEKHAVSEREISELTLKRLHTLGNQKFGSSPFSDYFVRWLMNVTVVLNEFESNPNITVDKQYVKERLETLSTIKLQLEERRRKENSIDREINFLSDWRTRLKRISAEYSSTASTVKTRKNRELKQLYKSISSLEKQQEQAMQLKTGFLRGLSKKTKEKMEIEIAQSLNDEQRKLELAILDFRVMQKELKEKYEEKREPVIEQIKFFQKKVADLEEDNSLEERWFACEALEDAVNSFLQRKMEQKYNSLKGAADNN